MRLRTMLVPAMSVFVLLAGCGTQSGSVHSGSAGTPAVAAMPVRSELKIVVPSKVNSVDPLIAATITEVEVMRLASSTLFNLNYDGKGVTPGLAESGQLAADGRSYLLTLKSGLTFSDGSPLTSADVVATFDRALTFKLNTYAGEFQPITKIVAEGPTVVKFTFNRPYPSFQTMISFPEFSILKKSEIGANGAVPDVPIMAGPYVIQGDVHGNSYALIRDPDYYGPRPSVNKISFSVVSDAAGRLAQVRGGQADFSTDVDAQALGQTMSGASVHTDPSMIVSQLTFANNTAPLNDVRIRQAISLALGRKQISEIAWAGAMPPDAGLLPTNSLGADPGNPNAEPTQAKQLLRGTACQSGCTLSLLLDGSSQWQSAAATVIAENLQAIGINVQVQPLETNTLYNRLAAGSFQLALGYFGTYADVPDATPQYCLSYAYGFLSCYSDYKSAAAEAAVNRAVTATSTESLKAAYGEVNAIFAKDAPLATLTDFAAVWAAGDNANGYASIGPTALLYIAPAKN